LPLFEEQKKEKEHNARSSSTKRFDAAPYFLATFLALAAAGFFAACR
jgi:hypothetical protein